jgi:hypothetical protein
MNYREMFMEGEIEAGTLVDVIEDLEAKIEQLEKTLQSYRNFTMDILKGK